MMKIQFLLTWVVLFGVVGVYSQLQQHGDLEISDEGLYESHERVARGSRQPTQNSVYIKSGPSPPSAHSSSTGSHASRVNTKNEISKLRNEMQQINKQAGTNVYDGRRKPPSAHGSSTASHGSKYVASVQKDMRRGDKEFEIRKLSRDGFGSVPEKQKYHRSRRFASIGN